MIFGNIHNIGECPFSERILECFDYIAEHDLLEYAPGCHDIEGKRLFVNIVEYTTTLPENRFWEAHRKYLDLHFMLRGTEQIDLNFIRNMTWGDFVEEDDFLPLEGEKNASVILREGDFLICYPGDGHRTAVAAEEPELIKKAIFKIQIPYEKDG